MSLLATATVAQPGMLDLLKSASPLQLIILAILLGMSIFSWAIIISKLGLFGKSREANRGFMRGFRKAPGLDAMAAAVEQYRHAPLSTVFQSGYDEIQRQVKERGTLINREALDRALQIGTSEELSILEANLNWLATTANISPFVGLFGTVLGIINAFQGLGAEGSNTLRTVAPGIAEALVATAAGLFAAIPAAVAYNYFSNQLRDLSTRMDDFALEFMNATERKFGG